MSNLPDAVAAEIKALKEQVSADFTDKIKALDTKADEKWAELQRSPDAVLGNSLKAILDDRVKATEDKAEAIQKALTDRMDEIESKARGLAGGTDYEAEMTKALDGFEFKPRSTSDRASLTLPLKAVVTITNANANAAGFTAPRPGITEYPQDPLALRNMVAPGSIDGYFFKYERELAASLEGDAAYQGAEGTAKAAMDIYTELVTDEVATIAVTSRVSSQVFADRSAFISFLRGRMGYRVLRKLDREILNGAGGSNEITGINSVATAYGNSHVGNVTNPQMLDVIRFARNQVELYNYAPDGICLNPTDWAVIETLKDQDRRYLIGDPKTSGSTGIGSVGAVWGMPVITTAGQTADEFTLGDWMGGAQLLMRQELEILASTEDQDNFVKNLVTLRAELRALLAVYSATAFVTGDFSDAIAAT